jgi:hypothetical protein
MAASVNSLSWRDSRNFFVSLVVRVFTWTDTTTCEQSRFVASAYGSCNRLSHHSYSRSPRCGSDSSQFAGARFSYGN